MQNFLGIVQSTNQQLAVVLDSLPERLGIVEDVVALRQVEGEILGFRLEVRVTHFIFHDIDEDETMLPFVANQVVVAIRTFRTLEME